MKPVAPPTRMVEATVNGTTVRVSAGTTILAACRELGVEPEIPTLCHGPTITPKNACRLCVVELEGARTLVPSCSRKVEPGMVIHTDTPRVRQARKLVLELLGSAVDLSLTEGVARWNEEYGATPARFVPDSQAATQAQPVKDDNDLYVRDYSKCILCYQCVDACGPQHQNTFAIAVAGRGFDSHISTEFDAPLPESACVFCGNCVQVCPTGALMFSTEHRMRADGTWDDAAQTTADTVCPFCGVGCAITLHVQDGAIVKTSSPADHCVTHGNLCIKGRFGFQHVQNR